MKNVNVALLQLCSGRNTQHNLAQIEQQIKQLPSSQPIKSEPKLKAKVHYKPPLVN